MKLAVVSKYPPPAEGISEYGRYVAQALAGRPDVERVTVVANIAPDAAPRSADVDVHRVWAANDPRVIGSILGELARLRPDGIWYNLGLTMFGDGPPALLGFMLPAITHQLGIRSVVTIHEQPIGQLHRVGAPGGPVRRLGIRLALGSLRFSHALCVTTRSHFEAVRSSAFRGPAQLAHLPLCGYAEPALEPLPPLPTALILTSHAPHKNLSVLLDAFRGVQRHLPHARLLVAGIDHPRFPGYLASIRRQYPHVPNVEWLGEVAEEDVRPLICRAGVTVVPYRVATGSSATLHQAVSLGRPVIVADLPEFRATAHEEDLWLEFFTRDDTSSLAASLERLLSDPERCRQMAEHNLASAQRNSLATTATRYLQLLQPNPERWPAVVTSASSSPGL